MSEEKEVRKSYQQELRELKEMVEDMGDLSTRAISLAVESLVELDEEKMEKVRDLDDEVYDYDKKIEKKALNLIALQAPVAKDLRIIGSSLQIITDLNRISRYSKDIVKVTERMIENGHIKKLISIPHMADITINMVELSVDSFMEEDESYLEEIYEKEDMVDALYDEIFREVLTYMMEDGDYITQGTQYVLVIRYLERIADHACNIIDRVVYMETGERVEMET